MNIHNIDQGTMESVLNEGLCVLINCEAGEGEPVRMVEVNAEGKPTGRTFFSRVAHDLGGGVVQVTMSPYMEAENDEGGIDRIPMAGDFANEKYVTPEGEWKDWQCAVKGEKPIWIYRGMKWVQELSLSKLFFGGVSPLEFAMNRMAPPHTLHVKVQAQGGEKVFKYTVAGEVN